MAVTWNGIVTEQITQAAVDGITEACEVLLAQAVDQTPWVEHHLRNSGTTDVGVFDDVVDGVVSFNTPYARKQHEDLDLNHPNGGNAKFLERPANAFAAELEQILASHLRGVIG